MKRLLLFTLLCLPFVVNAQGLKYSRAYLGAVLQDSRPGGSLILSYGINKYIGIGAGVDMLTYKMEFNKESKFFAPFYADLRLKYPVKMFEPFIMGQFGKPSYENKEIAYSDLTGVPVNGISQQGKSFYGVGGGVMLRYPHHLGVFVSATYRKYSFSYSPDHYEINGNRIDFEKYNKGMLLLSLGVVF